MPGILVGNHGNEWPSVLATGGRGMEGGGGGGGGGGGREEGRGGEE